MSTDNFEAMFAAALENAGTSAGPSRPRIDIEGDWVVKVTEASFGASQKGDTKRAMLKAEVVASIGETPDRTSALVNLYITDALAGRNVAPWANALIAHGISADKIKEDATDWLDVINNIVGIINKQIKRGQDIKVHLQTRKQDKLDDKGRTQFYKNVYVLKTETPKETDPFANM